MAKMRVTEALDERDLLKKKIVDAIQNTTFVDACREKDTTIQGKTIEEIEQAQRSAYQSITDMITRYNKINSAITLNNATAIITLKDGTTMTRAAAIALRHQRMNNKDFSQFLLSQLKSDNGFAVNKLNTYNREYEKIYSNTTSSMIASSSDKKNTSALDDEQLKAAATFSDPYKGKMIDALNIEQKIKDLQAKIDAFNAEIDTQIKISNVSEFIEIED